MTQHCRPDTLGSLPTEVQEALSKEQRLAIVEQDRAVWLDSLHAASTGDGDFGLVLSDLIEFIETYVSFAPAEAADND